jgi:nucleoside-diphosphate-sugar epimerase
LENSEFISSGQKKRLLVTGGSGFIGSNLAREFSSRGHEVWLCDVLHCEIDNLVRCDVSKYRQVERMFEAHDFDYVYYATAEYGRWNGEDYESSARYFREGLKCVHIWLTENWENIKELSHFSQNPSLN